MKHEWERSGLCLYCGMHCPVCNDCQCPGGGWTRYATTSCPRFDTHAGRDRPTRESVMKARIGGYMADAPEFKATVDWVAGQMSDQYTARVEAAEASYDRLKLGLIPAFQNGCRVYQHRPCATVVTCNGGPPRACSFCASAGPFDQLFIKALED